MPTEKPRVTFTISKEKLEELERFQHENRIKNQTQAVLALIEKGLSGYETDTNKSPSTAEAAPGEALHSVDDWKQAIDKMTKKQCRDAIILLLDKFMEDEG